MGGRTEVDEMREVVVVLGGEDLAYLRRTIANNLKGWSKIPDVRLTEWERSDVLSLKRISEGLKEENLVELTELRALAKRAGMLAGLVRRMEAGKPYPREIVEQVTSDALWVLSELVRLKIDHVGISDTDKAELKRMVEQSD